MESLINSITSNISYHYSIRSKALVGLLSSFLIMFLVIILRKNKKIDRYTILSEDEISIKNMVNELRNKGFHVNSRCIDDASTVPILDYYAINSIKDYVHKVFILEELGGFRYNIMLKKSLPSSTLWKIENFESISGGT